MLSAEKHLWTKCETLPNKLLLSYGCPQNWIINQQITRPNYDIMEAPTTFGLLSVNSRLFIQLLALNNQKCIYLLHLLLRIPCNLSTQQSNIKYIPSKSIGNASQAFLPKPRPLESGLWNSALNDYYMDMSMEASMMYVHNNTYKDAPISPLSQSLGHIATGIC